jgi:hypothetical protein
MSNIGDQRSGIIRGRYGWPPTTADYIKLDVDLIDQHVPSPNKKVIETLQAAILASTSIAFASAMIDPFYHRRSSDVTVQLLESELLPTHASIPERIGVGLLVIITAQGLKSTISLFLLIIRCFHQGKYTLGSRSISILIYCPQTSYRVEPTPSYLRCNDIS